MEPTHHTPRGAADAAHPAPVTTASLEAALRDFRRASSPPARPRAWLRHREDARAVAFVALTLALTTAGFALPRGAWAPHLALVPAACAMAFLCAVITHNATHAPVFTRAWMNASFRGLLTLAYGHPASAFEPGHNLSHHRYSQTARDATRTTRLRYRSNLLNQLLFYPSIAGAVARSEGRYLRWAWRSRPRWFRRFAAEAALLAGYYAGALALDWRRFALYVALPHAWAVWGIMGINFAQHDGCDPESPANHSRNFTGAALNWLAFNNGYHGVHHLAPELHWSLLPEAHAAVLRPHLHPALERRSLVAWLVASFVWPGERRRYDGRPVELPPPVDDEDWVADAAHAGRDA